MNTILLRPEQGVWKACSVVLGLDLFVKPPVTWRPLPPRFGPRETVCNRYQCRRGAGIEQRIIDNVRQPRACQ